MQRLSVVFAIGSMIPAFGQVPITQFVLPDLGYFTQSVSLGQNATWRQADGDWLVKFVEQSGVVPQTTTFEGLMSLDTLLNIQWSRRFTLNGEGSQVKIGDVKPMDDGGYVVAMAVDDTTLQVQYSVVERYTSAHALVWQHTLRSDACEVYPFDLHAPQGVLLIDDHFYIGHLACSPGNGFVIPSLTKLDTLGNAVWTKQYDAGPSGGLTTAWVATPDGIALCGNASFVTLIDTAGSVLWVAGPWGDLFPMHAIATQAGGVAVLCRRFIGNSDLVLAKVTETGDTAWVREMVSAAPEAVALTEDPDSTVRVLWRTGLETHETRFDAGGAISAVTSWEDEPGRYCWAAGPWSEGWLMVFRQNGFTDMQLTRQVPGSTAPCFADAQAVAVSAITPITSAAGQPVPNVPNMQPVSTALVSEPVSFVQQPCLSTHIPTMGSGQDLLAWPIPADKELIIRMEGWAGSVHCVVLDQAGRVVWEQSATSSGSFLINTVSWPSGSYIALVGNEARLEHLRAVVVH